MRNEKGQFIKGYHYHTETEFKKGQHWRKKKPFWDKEWLEKEYHQKDRTSLEIGKQFNVSENAILFWIWKHKLKRKSMSEIRSRKYWGLRGKKNGMYGKRGKLHPNWQGGSTPYRQKVYASSEWRELARQIWAETKGKCQFCFKKGKEIHHLLPVAPFPELIMVKWYLCLICKNCHKKITVPTYKINSPEDLKNLILKRKIY